MVQKLKPFWLRGRFFSSAAATVLMNLGFMGLFFRAACTPGFNCHGCPWAVFACPVGVVAYASAVHTVPWFAIGIVLASAVFIGRMICSHLCPFGLLQDLLHKVPSRKFEMPRWSRYGKYATLALLVIVLPFIFGFSTGGYLQVDKPMVNKAENGQILVQVRVTNPGTEPLAEPQLMAVFRGLGDQAEVFRQEERLAGVVLAPGQSLDWPGFFVPNHLANAELSVESPQSVIALASPYQLYYCRLCPNGTLTATLPSFFTGQSTVGQFVARHWLRLGILALFLALMVLFPRPFCRLFCPLGAIYALTARLSLNRLTIEQPVCTSCQRCDKACPVGLDVRRELSGPECISCGDCKVVCTQLGIKRKYGP